MTQGCIKSIKSIYKHVQGITSIGSNKIYWRIKMKKLGKNSFDTEREAALEVDKYLITKGKSPVNILKPKN